MKSIITFFTIATLALLGTTTSAEARHRKKRVTFSSHQSCGTPVYTQRYLIGYDQCGEPIFGYRTVRSYYQPVVRPRYQSGYNEPRYYSDNRSSCR